METTHYGFSVTLQNTPLEQAIERVTASLAAVGFGVLTRIDVDQTLKAKLDLDFRPYSILGACNPGLAIQALNDDPEIGLWMPCNVVVQQHETDARVSVINPNTMIPLVEGEEVKRVMGEAQTLLIRALQQA